MKLRAHQPVRLRCDSITSQSRPFQRSLSISPLSTLLSEQTLSRTKPSYPLISISMYLFISHLETSLLSPIGSLAFQFFGLSSPLEDQTLRPSDD